VSDPNGQEAMEEGSCLRRGASTVFPILAVELDSSVFLNIYENFHFAKDEFRSEIKI